MSEFWLMILGIIGSVGVGGSIVAGLSSWLGRVWADRLMAKETAKFREDLEHLTKQLERKNYVSKVRFDAEFAIYQELSKAFFDLIIAQNNLFTFYKLDSLPSDPSEKIEVYKKRYETARTAYNSTMDILHKNTPFIKKEIFDKFDNILYGVKQQLHHYPSFYIEDDAAELRQECKEIFEKCSKKTLEIDEQMKNLFTDLREYLKTLDVIDKK